MSIVSTVSTCDHKLDSLAPIMLLECWDCCRGHESLVLVALYWSLKCWDRPWRGLYFRLCYWRKICRRRGSEFRLCYWLNKPWDFDRFINFGSVTDVESHGTVVAAFINFGSVTVSLMVFFWFRLCQWWKKSWSCRLRGLEGLFEFRRSRGLWEYPASVTSSQSLSVATYLKATIANRPLFV